mmetsp:Transcript_51695/g.83872  ORF Transcript_51695/g.83872 Transcript_51695/m.83872 type:complete len:258 (+) Transcript_51695:197-970(+)
MSHHHRCRCIVVQAVVQVDVVANAMVRDAKRQRARNLRPGRQGGVGTLVEHHRDHRSIQRVVIRVRDHLPKLEWCFLLIINTNLETLVVRYVQDIVHVPLTVLRLGLIRSEAPVIVHDELVLVHASRNILDNGEFLPRAHHGDLIPPAIEGGCQEHNLASLRPGEDDRDAIVPLDSCLGRRRGVKKRATRRHHCWRAGHGEHGAGAASARQGPLPCLGVAHGGPRCARRLGGRQAPDRRFGAAGGRLQSISKVHCPY